MRDANETPVISRRDILRYGVVSTAAAAARTGHSPPVGAADEPLLTIAIEASHLGKVQSALDLYQKRSGVALRAASFGRDDLYTELTISLTQQTGSYDVISVEDAWLPVWTAEDALADLGERFKPVKPGVEFDVLSAFQSLGADATGARQLAMPWVGDVKLFAWQVAAFESVGDKAPATLDDVLAAARRITEAGAGQGNYGYGVPRRAGSPLAISFLSTLWACGGDLLDPPTQEPQLETPAASRAMALFLQLSAQAPPERADGASDAAADFRGGSVAMTSDIWPGDLFAMTDASAPGSGPTFGAGPARPQAGRRGGSLTGAWLFAVPKQSKRLPEALNFIEWMTSPAVQRSLLLEGRIAPTRRSVLRDVEANARYPFLAGLLEAAQTSRPRSRSPLYPGLEAILARWVRDAVSGDRTADEALRGANREMRALLVREGVLA